MSAWHLGAGDRLDRGVRRRGSVERDAAPGVVASEPHRRCRSHNRARVLASFALLGAVLLGVGCAPTRTDELGSSAEGAGSAAGAAAPDGYPTQAPDGYPSPQVMAEVTLPDGSVATVPQPEVPVVTEAPAAGSGSSSQRRVPATSVVGPTDSRAVQKLSSAASIAASSKALGLLRLDWRGLLPGWQIRFLPGRAGIRGATFPDTSVIEIYVRASDTPNDLAHVIAHELGHAVDVSRFSDADRSAWKAARGIAADVVWFPGGSGSADYWSGAGDWAESFAWWLVGSGWFSKLGSPPDVGQKALVAALAGVG